MRKIEDYIDIISLPNRLNDPVLKDATVKMLPNGLFPWRSAGGFCIVFHLVAKNGQQYAVRCWHSHIEFAQKRCREVSEKINNAKLPYFVHFDYVDKALLMADGTREPIVRMEWVEALNLKAYIIANKGNPNKLKKLAEDFYAMCCALHHAKLSHGDLNHDNIVVRENGEIVLLDYDSVYHPSMGQISALVQGKWDYQHPSRKKVIYASANIDAFSELIIYTSILYLAENPDAIDSRFAQTDYLIFGMRDYANFRASDIFKKLTAHSTHMAYWAEVIAKGLESTSLDNIPNVEQAKEGKTPPQGKSITTYPPKGPTYTPPKTPPIQRKKTTTWQGHIALWLAQQRKEPSMNRVGFILSCLLAHGTFWTAQKSARHFLDHTQTSYQIASIAIYALYFLLLFFITVARLRNAGLRFGYKVYFLVLVIGIILHLVTSLIDSGIGETPLYTILILLCLFCLLVPQRSIALQQLQS